MKAFSMGFIQGHKVVVFSGCLAPPKRFAQADPAKQDFGQEPKR